MNFRAFLLILIFSSYSLAQKIEVKLNQRSLVASLQKVMLYDIIDIQAAPFEMKKSLFEVEIDLQNLTKVNTHLYNENTEIQVPASEILAQVRKKLSAIQWSQFLFVASESIALKFQRNFVSENYIAYKIEEKLSQVCNSCELKFENLKIPSVSSQLEVLSTSLDVSSLQKAGSFLLPLFLQTSQKKETYWITGTTHFVASVPVLNRSVKQNERITESDFEVKKIAIGIAADGILKSNELIGKTLKSDQKAGAVVSPNLIKREYDIVKGDTIRVLVGDGDIEITGTGIADNSGFVGDAVKIKLSDKAALSNNIINGKIVSKGLVRVE